MHLIFFLVKITANAQYTISSCLENDTKRYKCFDYHGTWLKYTERNMYNQECFMVTV